MSQRYLSSRTKTDSLLVAAAATFIALVIVATLYSGREIFVPLALASLLSFVLAPLVQILQRLRAPRTAAVVVVVAVAFAILFVLGAAMGRQISQLAADLPRYEATIREKVKMVRGASAGDGTLERAADMLQTLGKELDKPALSKTPGFSAPSEPSPIPVIVSQPPPGPLDGLSSLIAPLLHPLATTGLIVVFVIFILAQREELRNKLIRLGGTRDIQRTTAALDDAAARLSRLFLMQLAINAVFGVVIATGLWLIGIPSYALWGMLAGALRFVPYIGAAISAAFPLALAAAVDPGWTMLIATALLFVIVEPLVGHALEPIILGQSTGLSPVAVVLAAAFWTMLWGPIGLVLSTPLTVCMVVLGRHVERLAFIEILLGDQPSLAPFELLYQRLLADDASEAVTQAEDFLKDKPLTAYYDDIVLPALNLAQVDWGAERLEASRAETIRGAVSDLVADLAEHGVELDALRPENSGSASTPDQAPTLLCMAAKSPLDDAAAVVMADLLGKQIAPTRVESFEALTTSRLFQLDLSGVSLVALTCLAGDSASHVRNLVKRLRRKQRGLRVIVVAPGLDHRTRDDWRRVCEADVASSFGEAIRICAEILVPTPDANDEPALNAAAAAATV